MLRLFEIPLHLHGTFAALMRAGTKAGRNAGMDADWFPQTPDEALFELLLQGSPRVTLAANSKPSYPLALLLRINEESFQPQMENAGMWDGNPDTINAALFDALSSPYSPVDLGFEIVGLHTPTTAHSKIAKRARMAQAMTA